MTTEDAKWDGVKQPAARSIALCKIAADSDMREVIERRIREQITIALAAGATWQAIGGAVGTTTQSAWERYRLHCSPTAEQRALWVDDS